MNPQEQVEKETQEAIERGWDASKVGWRRQALLILLATAVTRRSFTVDDFRDRIKASGIVTHDNRAMGGLMVTAYKWGWIAKSGDAIKSKVGHKSPLQIWQSRIYQEPSAREVRETRQEALFASHGP